MEVSGDQHVVDCLISKPELMRDILHKAKAPTSQRRFMLTEDIPRHRVEVRRLPAAQLVQVCCLRVAGSNPSQTECGELKIWGGGSPETGFKGDPREEAGCDSVRALSRVSLPKDGTSFVHSFVLKMPTQPGRRDSKGSMSLYLEILHSG